MCRGPCRVGGWLVLVLSRTCVGCMSRLSFSLVFPPNWAEFRPLSMLIRKVKFGWLAHLVRNISMGKKLYVGNLSYNITNESLSTMFSAHGTVDSAQVIMDRETNRSKGFGFVEMANAQEADAAIAALNGQDND